MARTQWDADARPVNQTLDQLLYAIRRDDHGEGLLLDAVSVQDILADADSVLTLDAMVVPYAQLQRKMEVLQGVMERAGTAVKPVAMQISEPFRQQGVAQIAVVYELSDGQSVSIYFHNPDVTPKKIAPTDELISWKWLLNRKDITIVVAPERGQDLNVREVARRIIALAEKNSAAFARANGRKAETFARIEGLKTEIVVLEGELKAAEHDLEVAKVEAEDRAMKAAEFDPTSPDGYAKVMADEGLKQKYKRVLNDFFFSGPDDRSTAVRNAIEALGWEPPKGLPARWPLLKGAGQIDIVWDTLSPGDNVVGASYRVKGVPAPIPDDLTQTPEQLAAQIDAAAVPAVVEPEPMPIENLPVGWGVESDGPGLYFVTRNGERLPTGYESLAAAHAGALALAKPIDLNRQRFFALEKQANATSWGTGSPTYYGVIDDQNGELPDNFMPETGNKTMALDMGEMVKEHGEAYAVQINVNKDKPFRVIMAMYPDGRGVGSQWAATPDEAYAMLPGTQRITAIDPAEAEEAARLAEASRIAAEEKAAEDAAEAARVAAATAVVVPAQQPLPWDGAKSEDETRWYGTKLRLYAIDRKRAISGMQMEGAVTLESVIDGGKLLSVRWPDADYSRRVSARDYVVEVTDLVDSKPAVVPEPTPEPTPDPKPDPYTDKIAITEGPFKGFSLESQRSLGVDSDTYNVHAKNGQQVGYIERESIVAFRNGDVRGFTPVPGWQNEFSLALQEKLQLRADVVEPTPEPAPEPTPDPAPALRTPLKINLDRFKTMLNSGGFGPNYYVRTEDKARLALQKGTPITGYLTETSTFGSKVVLVIGGEEYPYTKGKLRPSETAYIFGKQDGMVPEPVPEPTPVDPVPEPTPEPTPEPAPIADPDIPTATDPDAPITPEGAENIVKTAKGTKVVTGFAVVEAKTLIVSHKINGDPNPDYPAELQPRDRSRESSIAWVIKTSKHLDPDSLGKTRRADTGAPIVGPDRVVESGNGRTMAIIEAYRTGNAEEYRQWLIDEAETFKLNPNRIKSMKAPVLVRIRTSDMDRRAFAIEANQDDKLAMTGTEKARADSDLLDSALLSKMSDDGDLLAASNRPFVSSFLASLGEAEAAQYMTTSGQPTGALIARIQAAVFAKAYSDDRLLELTADASKPDVASVIAALNSSAPEFIRAQEADKASADALTTRVADSVEVSLNLQVINALVDATNLVRKAKAEGRSVDEEVSQMGLFDDIPPATAAMAVFISKNNRSAKRLSVAFTAMARRVRIEAERGATMDLFGDNEKASLEMIISAANQELDREYGEGKFAIDQLDLFGRKDPDPVPDPTPDPTEDPMKSADRALFQSVIDGTADPLTVDLEAMEAAAIRNESDPELTALFEQAVEVVLAAEGKATEGV